MKIEIDLQEILTDEYGDAENLAQSIERQIVDNLSANFVKLIQKNIEEETNKIIQSYILEAAKQVTEKLSTDLIDLEYYPVDTYGSRSSKPTTMRNEFIKTLQEQMVYKKTQYSSDKNYFTKNVDEILSSELDKFKKEYNSQVNEIFVKEALEYAVKKLKETLKID